MIDDIKWGNQPIGDITNEDLVGTKGDELQKKFRSAERSLITKELRKNRPDWDEAVKISNKKMVKTKEWQDAYRKGLLQRDEKEKVKKRKETLRSNPQILIDLKKKFKKQRQDKTYKENQRQKHLTGFEYHIKLPNGKHFKSLSSNEILRKIGLKINKKTGGVGYRFFPKDCTVYHPQAGKFVDYKFYKKKL